MNQTLAGSLFFSLVGLGLIACSGQPGSVGTSSEQLAASSTTGATGTPPRATTAVPLCVKGDKLCRVENVKTGKCEEVCVPDTYLCVAPKACTTPPIVCDPSGPRPNPACSWDEKTCTWDCPVCDPSGPKPNPACSWDTTACKWDCPVCDPSGPAPNPACSWDATTCAWDCPVCDPVGSPPHPGCTWDTTTCKWDCPVCDPPPPPEKSGCTWDEAHCVWLCL